MLALGGMDYDNHTSGRGRYIYIHTSCTMQAHRARKKMPTSLEHGPKYRCKKVQRGHRTLEMRTSGTWHDIPNTNHLGEKGKRNEMV